MAKPNQGLLDAARKAGAPDVPEADEDLQFVDDDDDDFLNGLEPNDDGETSPKADDSANQPAGDGDDDLAKFPENFFGENIRAYAEEHGVEAAETYYNALQDANKVANSRLREISEERKKLEEVIRAKELERRTTAPEPNDADDPRNMSDEDALAAFGMDPDLLEYESVGKPIAQMARELLATRQQFEHVSRESAADRAEREWHSKLDSIEATEGKMTYEDGTPIPRADLEQFAIEKRILDPEALYWTVMGPVFAKKNAKVTKKADATDKKVRDLKRSISTPRRRGGSGKATQVAKPQSLKDHLENAAKGMNVDPSSLFNS